MYIQELSKKLRISKKAINLYEEKGLIPPQKDNKGYRVYHKHEQQMLLRIKQLRQMNFTIAEIKEILIEHHYELFEKKKADYQKQIYDIETSIDFIDSVQECIERQEDMSSLPQDLDQAFKLKERTTFQRFTIDFEKLIFWLMFLAVMLASKSQGQDDIYEMISSVLVLISFSIYASPRIKVFAYQIYQKLKK